MDERRITAGSAAGMTLVELLFVMGLIALLMGVGLGAITSLDVGQKSQVALVQSALRSANNWAIAQEAPALVRIDKKRGAISSEGLAVIGTWHFESDPPKGAFGLDGYLIDAPLVDDGFMGKAVSFRDSPSGGRYEVSVQKDPSYDLSRGFHVALALRPEGARGGRVLQIGGSVGLDVTPGLGLKAWFGAARVDEVGRTVSAGNAVLKTEDGELELGRWSRVLVTYDRSFLRVFVEGVLIAALQEDALVAEVDGPLVLGSGQRPWPGSVDALVISAVGASEEIVLEDGARFTEDAPTRIAFAPGGGLDRAAHREPVELTIEFEDGKRTTLRVGLYGGVE